MYFVSIRTTLVSKTRVVLLMMYFWVILGGGIGTALRFLASGLISRYFGEVFPLGTLCVNVSGCFTIGLFASLTRPDGIYMASPEFRHFIMTGILGGYTTFSSFSLQTLYLANDGQWLYATLNAILSLLLCLIAVWLGQVGASFLAGR